MARAVRRDGVGAAAAAAAAAAAVGGSVRAQLLIRHALKPMDAGAVSAKI